MSKKLKLLLQGFMQLKLNSKVYSESTLSCILSTCDPYITLNVNFPLPLDDL